jgi:homogentisate 1,2-dioxygenase
MEKYMSNKDGESPIDLGSRTPPSRPSDLTYQAGFGNQHASEAIVGALPIGRNSPQRHPLGLYTEQISGTSFTAPRADNRRTWVYRIFPSAASQGKFDRIESALLPTTRMQAEATPNRHRWERWPIPSAPIDFVAGLTPIAISGRAEDLEGVTIYSFAINRSMFRRVFTSVDGELLIIPQTGKLHILTELGALQVDPGEIILIPRGIRFSVRVESDSASGYVCENFGASFRLPELGLIGANGLANARDFLAPTAQYENDANPVECVMKFGGALWTCQLRRSPFDVVAWHGNLVPYKYSLWNFNALNSVTYDHSDPSIFTVLTSPSAIPGVANSDFAALPPRWSVSEGTFRPPWFHRNVMSEFVISLFGPPEARGSHYQVQSAHLHNCMGAHGPDPEVFSRASSVDLKPTREESLGVMFESRLSFRVTDQAMNAANHVSNYSDNWAGMPVLFEAV